MAQRGGTIGCPRARTRELAMPLFICTACGMQYANSVKPPAQCVVCEEERQYVPPRGQTWTTLDALAQSHMNSMREYEPGVIGIGSYSRMLFIWLCASASSVVQVCPRGGTYCRSSSQTTHCAGGFTLFAYCMPQAVQMKRGIASSRVRARGQPMVPPR